MISWGRFVEPELYLVSISIYILFSWPQKSLSLTTASHENEDWINGEKTEDIVDFLDRLYTAKRKVEKRIVVLGGEADPVSYVSFCHKSF